MYYDRESQKVINVAKNGELLETVICAVKGFWFQLEVQGNGGTKKLYGMMNKIKKIVKNYDLMRIEINIEKDAEIKLCYIKFNTPKGFDMAYEFIKKEFDGFKKWKEENKYDLDVYSVYTSEISSKCKLKKPKNINPFIKGDLHR